jgi:hypothetical protein
MQSQILARLQRVEGVAEHSEDLEVDGLKFCSIEAFKPLDKQSVKRSLVKLELIAFVLTNQRASDHTQHLRH